jgi:hypothetical protein
MNIQHILNVENSWVGISLIDITSTGITRGESIQRNQQRNWESLIQALSLKTQIEILAYPEKIEHFKINDSLFGNFYSSMQTVWAFSFYSESDVYTEELLVNDCDHIPMTLHLEETAKFMLPITHTRGTLKNLHFFNCPNLKFNK